jgi:hypothetical protein
MYNLKICFFLFLVIFMYNVRCYHVEPRVLIDTLIPHQDSMFLLLEFSHTHPLYKRLYSSMASDRVSVVLLLSSLKAK